MVTNAQKLSKLAKLDSITLAIVMERLESSTIKAATMPLEELVKEMEADGSAKMVVPSWWQGQCREIYEIVKN